MRLCVRACVRECVRACVRACVLTCVCVCVCARAARTRVRDACMQATHIVSSNGHEPRSRLALPACQPLPAYFHPSCIFLSCPPEGPSLPLKSHILLYQGEGALPRLFLLCLPLFFLSIVLSVCLSRPQRCLASMPTTSWKLLRLNAWETHQIPAETSDLPKGHSISRASSTTSILCPACLCLATWESLLP